MTIKLILEPSNTPSFPWQVVIYTYDEFKDINDIDIWCDAQWSDDQVYQKSSLGWIFESYHDALLCFMTWS